VPDTQIALYVAVVLSNCRISQKSFLCLPFVVNVVASGLLRNCARYTNRPACCRSVNQFGLESSNFSKVISMSILCSTCCSEQTFEKLCVMPESPYMLPYQVSKHLAMNGRISRNPALCPFCLVNVGASELLRNLV